DLFPVYVQYIGIDDPSKEDPGRHPDHGWWQIDLFPVPNNSVEILNALVFPVTRHMYRTPSLWNISRVVPGFGAHQSLVLLLLPVCVGHHGPPADTIYI